MTVPKVGGNWPAMPYADVPAFVKSLRDQQTVYARAIELLVLAWARKNEVLNMVWSEVDFDRGDLDSSKGTYEKWTPSPSSPASERAVEILREQHVATAGQGFVFPSVTGRGKPINSTTLNRFVPKPYTPHRFRSAARDWAGDMTAHEREVAEMFRPIRWGTASRRPIVAVRHLRSAGNRLRLVPTISPPSSSDLSALSFWRPMCRWQRAQSVMRRKKP